MSLSVAERSELVILDDTGDTKVLWDQAQTAEVSAARAMFQKLKAEGYLAYRVDRTGEKAEVLHEFDPTAEKVILSPPMRGG